MQNARFLVIVFLLISQQTYADLWVWEGNFQEFPFYKESDEKSQLSNCDGLTCVVGNLLNNKKYYRAYLLNEGSQLIRVYGIWSGGDCQSDTWQLNEDGSFASKYPLEGKMYSWSGKYSFKDNLYIEEGINNDEEREHNEANLYYVPTLDKIIYKGVKSFDGYDESGKEKYVNYSGPDFYYFKRCKNP